MLSKSVLNTRTKSRAEHRTHQKFKILLMEQTQQSMRTNFKTELSAHFFVSFSPDFSQICSCWSQSSSSGVPPSRRYRRRCWERRWRRSRTGTRHQWTRGRCKYSLRRKKQERDWQLMNCRSSFDIWTVLIYIWITHTVLVDAWIATGPRSRVRHVDVLRGNIKTVIQLRVQFLTIYYMGIWTMAGSKLLLRHWENNHWKLQLWTFTARGLYCTVCVKKITSPLLKNCMKAVGSIRTKIVKFQNIWANLDCLFYLLQTSIKINTYLWGNFSVKPSPAHL